MSPRPPASPTSRLDTARRPRVPLVVVAIAGLVVVLVVAAIVIVAVGGDDNGTATGPDPSTSEPLVEQDYSPVTVEGEALAPLPKGEDDPAIGEPAPGLTGETPGRGAITIDPADGPMVIAFVAHWCPHCQAEVPRIAELAGGEAEIDGVRLVAVATGTDPRKPNHPAGAWLAREGWAGSVMVDSEEMDAAQAYGLTSYPFLVAIDADGTVVARSAGELGDDGLAAFFAEVASAS